jgi:hypothetical protein
MTAASLYAEATQRWARDPRPTPRIPHRITTLGFIKYALATTAALAAGAIAFQLGPIAAAVVFVFAFYAVEAQMVFLMLLGSGSIIQRLRTSRAWTVRAGGTIAVMWIVMPIAARMLFGGFFGRGFIRSWCLGCIAVVVWFDRLEAA